MSGSRSWPTRPLLVLSTADRKRLLRTIIEAVTVHGESGQVTWADRHTTTDGFVRSAQDTARAPPSSANEWRLPYYASDHESPELRFRVRQRHHPCPADRRV